MLFAYDFKKHDRLMGTEKERVAPELLLVVSYCDREASFYGCYF